MQAVIIIRWVGKAPRCTSSLASTATLNATQGLSRRYLHNVFFRLNLPLNKFRRQCYKFRRQCYKFRRQCYKFRRQCYKFRRQYYDGVGNMSGQRTCVAKRIQELEPGQSNHILKATS